MDFSYNSKTIVLENSVNLICCILLSLAYNGMIMALGKYCKSELMHFVEFCIKRQDYSLGKTR